ncbi:ACP S-malonyltransferase [Longimicrobium sp.]|uniref:ACP S-malonyltransferase n=1 Tax=Longimicrobium sp. TaxID=2029185 RepID=UPI002ED9A497
MRAVMFPGQGAQSRGMGEALFRRYPRLARRASDIAGWDVEELCVHDPQDRLAQTQFTQPAMYVVNALTWLDHQDRVPGTPDFLLGHSLGEYNALLAAGAFDFETGLKLVLKRGELMGAAAGGGMLALVNVDAGRIERLLRDRGLEAVDIANHNSDNQFVVSGTAADIESARAACAEEGITALPLKVSAPFHSRHMRPARDEFAAFLAGFSFAPLQVPVIANATARPYEGARVAETLTRQITGAVLWRDSVQHLLGLDREMAFEEMGSSILTKMRARSALAGDAGGARSPASAPPGRERRSQVFCVSYAGGDARAYHGLAERLAGAEAVPLERPGRGSRASEPLLHDPDAVIDDLFAQIAPRIDGPYALYGHSLGARLAYLLARRLCEQGRAPARLFVSGEGSPAAPSREEQTWRLASDAFWRRLGAMGGVPPELLQHADLMAHYEPILRADFEVLSACVHPGGPQLDVPIAVMIGQDEAVSLADARKWQNETLHPLTVRSFPGDHFFIRRHWNEIAHLIETGLRN